MSRISITIDPYEYKFVSKDSQPNNIVVKSIQLLLQDVLIQDKPNVRDSVRYINARIKDIFHTMILNYTDDNLHMKHFIKVTNRNYHNLTIEVQLVIRCDDMEIEYRISSLDRIVNWNTVRDV